MSSVAGVREPLQERSRVTLARLTAATERLLREGGPQAVTVKSVAEAAGSSVGSFYARFRDREAVLRHVEDRFWEELDARWQGFLAPASWRGCSALEVVVGFVRTAVRAMGRQRRRHRGHLLQGLLGDPAETRRRTVALDHRIAERALDLLRPTGALDGREAEARGALLVVFSAMRDALTFQEDSKDAERELALRLVGLLCSVLEIPGPPRTWSDLLGVARRASRTTPPPGDG